MSRIVGLYDNKALLIYLPECSKFSNIPLNEMILKKSHIMSERERRLGRA